MVFEKIEALQKKISAADKITIEEQIDLDNEIMELQFNGINDVFEKMRDELSSKEIIMEDVGGAPDGKDAIMEDLETLSAEELADKYKITDANAVAKKLKTKRPKDGRKYVGEVEYWSHLKSLV